LPEQPAGPLGEPSDDELMKRLQEGDAQALAPLYRRYRGIVNAVIQRQAGISGDAEDLCHDVFLTLKDVAHRYQPGTTLQGWLCGIAIRKARRAGESNWLHRGLLARFFRAPPAVQAVELRGDVERILALLPAGMREVVVLSLVEQLRAEDVAAALDISVNTVWTRLHRARARIKEILAEDEA
jgi:RNA polymerase sigma factor (sigma-70 family)